MNTCKACHKEIPLFVVIDGVKHHIQHRKFCLECSPFKSHNTSININLSKEERRKLWKRYDYKYIHQKRKEQKRKLVEYKGGKCEMCGYDKPIMNAYVFHHKDPNEKEYQISTAMRKWEIAKREVDKCMLLCVRCHAELHATD